MQSKKLSRVGTLCVLFFLLGSILTVHSIKADDEAESYVNSTIEITFLTGTELTVDVTMDVTQITVFDTSYTTSEIDTLVGSDLETLGAIKLRLRDLLKNQLESSFAEAEVDATFDKPTYGNFVFTDEYIINLTTSFFDVDGSVDIDDLINGALDMGGKITYHFSLAAVFGWNNTYRFVLPASIKFKGATNTTDINPPLNRKITWMLQNWKGNHPLKDATLSIGSNEPTSDLTTEQHSLRFDLNAANIDKISLTTTIFSDAIDISNYDILPDCISELEIVPTDGLRLFIANGFLSWDDFYDNTINNIEQNTISTLEMSSFNQTLTMQFMWDSETTENCTTPFNISHMDSVPQIKAELLDEEVSLLVCGITARAFFGLINAGASSNITDTDIAFGDGLEGLGYPFEVYFYLPDNLSLQNDNIYIWNQTGTISGEFSSDLQPDPPYIKEKIEEYIEIDIEKMDLNIPSLLTGKTELTATVHSTKDDNLYVIEFPEEFSLSEKIVLDFLNSDAFRLCKEEKVFHENEVEQLLTTLKNNFEMQLSSVLNNKKIKGLTDESIFSDSLSWDGDISSMDGADPIIVSSYANNLYPINLAISIWPPSLKISNQSFTLQGLENRTTTYRIIFPKGLSVRAKDSLNKSIIEGKTGEGREYIEVSFSSTEGSLSDILTCQLRASTLYIIGMFLPCIISFILVIILIIVVLLLRRKIRGRGSKKVEEETTSYEDQDYYVPPPPGSK